MNTKLSPAQVAALRTLWATGEVTQRKLAQEFGIAQGHVSRLVRGVSQPGLPTVPNVFQRIANAAGK